MPWDLERLNQPPKWQALERPKVDRIKAITYDGLPFRGKTTRVFAWLGMPEVKPGEKVPAMVLIHGGGGTAFAEWVRLWVDRGYAAIAMDTCGQVPIGNYGKWFRDEQGGPAGWGGFDQLDFPREDQWTFHAVADAILAHSLIRSLPEVDPARTGVTGISCPGRRGANPLDVGRVVHPLQHAQDVVLGRQRAFGEQPPARVRRGLQRLQNRGLVLELLVERPTAIRIPLPPCDVEQRITFPVELAMQGLPRVREVRSLSKAGLSQVTVVFEDGVDIYFARQLVFQRLQAAKEELPEWA